MSNVPVIFRRSPKVVAAMIGETSFLLHVEEWVYLELNESARRIWELLDEDRSLDEMVEELRREFNVDRELCVSHASEFLVALEEKHFAFRE
jgi:hypothetical protein